MTTHVTGPRRAALPQGRAARRFDAQIVCAAEAFDRGSIKAKRPSQTCGTAETGYFAGNQSFVERKPEITIEIHVRKEH